MLKYSVNYMLSVLGKITGFWIEVMVLPVGLLMAWADPPEHRSKGLWEHARSMVSFSKQYEDCG